MIHRRPSTLLNYDVLRGVCHRESETPVEHSEFGREPHPPGAEKYQTEVGMRDNATSFYASHPKILQCTSKVSETSEV